jgi:hypothetical protein
MNTEGKRAAHTTSQCLEMSLQQCPTESRTGAVEGLLRGLQQGNSPSSKSSSRPLPALQIIPSVLLLASSTSSSSPRRHPAATPCTDVSISTPDVSIHRLPHTGHHDTVLASHHSIPTRVKSDIPSHRLCTRPGAQSPAACSVKLRKLAVPVQATQLWHCTLGQTALSVTRHSELEIVGLGRSQLMGPHPLPHPPKHHRHRHRRTRRHQRSPHPLRR